MPRLLALLLALLLAAAIPLLFYARTTGFGFVYADDADLIAGNQAFLGDLRHAPDAFTRSYFETGDDLTPLKTYYRPVAIVSFMIDAARAGADPSAYHATNVVLHAAAAVLLLVLARLWGAPPYGALAAALVFAVHPVNVQAVAWIAGRNDLLLAVFTLASLAAWQQASAKGVIGSGRQVRESPAVGWLSLHAVAFALALFSKEAGIVVPVLAALQQRFVNRKPLTRAYRLTLGADAAIVAVWMILRSRALGGEDGGIAIGERVTAAIANLPQLAMQLGKMVVPARLNVSPGVEPIGIAAGAVAALLLAWVARRRLPAGVAVVAACWVLFFLLPTLLVPGLPAYEHRVYLPLIGLLAALATAWPAQAGTRGALVVGVVVVALAGVAWQRQAVFVDPFSYWTDATRDARFAPIAHVNLGQLHEGGGRLGEARRQYLRALEIDPETPKAHNNLGVVLMALDQPEAARRHFAEEAQRHPWNADAWFNLGLWAERSGDMDEARRYWERAIAANPAYAPAYEKLGRPASGRGQIRVRP